MQNWSPDGVRQERSGWRDQEISARHRVWGFDCPGVDLDFVVAEFNNGKPIGIVEYKRHTAKQPDLEHPAMRCLERLAQWHCKPVGDSGEVEHDPLPFIIAFYWPDIWAFRVVPANTVANQYFMHHEILSELEWVRRIYAIRGLQLPSDVVRKCQSLLPDGVPTIEVSPGRLVHGGYAKQRGVTE